MAWRPETLISGLVPDLQGGLGGREPRGTYVDVSWLINLSWGYVGSSSS